MSDRNRAEGWKHAKLSGHKNEVLVAELAMQDAKVQKRLLDCANVKNLSIIKVEVGGLCEKNVCSVLGGTTKSKTDMKIYLSNGKNINVSIKKDGGGQVFLIGIDRFIRGFELHYNKTVPEQAKRAISLYFGSASDTIDIVKRYGANKKLELRKHRLVADTLKEYDIDLYHHLLKWINGNIGDLFDFCFVRGLANNSEDWAHIVWYKNMVGEYDFDEMFYLPDLKKRIPPVAVYGTKNGGSTIQLPFGFLQWHSPRKVIPGDLQFHHDFSKNQNL